MDAEQMRVFYNSVIDDLKLQIADLADQKATQVALNHQKQIVIDQQQKEIDRLIKGDELELQVEG